MEYCQIKKTDVGRAYTAATIRQTSKCGYAVGTRWRQEKKRTFTKDLATNIPGKLQEMRVSWSGIHRVASDQSR